MAYLYPWGNTQQLNLDWLLSQWQIAKNSIDQSLQAEIDRVEDAIADLLNARDQAVAAAASANNDAGDAHTDATNAHTDALAAAGDAASASADALKAEGNAVGEQNGTPVTSGSPYYQNNAKYYANEASSDATNAHTDSQAAAGNALYAEGWAVGEQNGTPVASGSPYYENNAKYYANSILGDAASAAADALEAEGWAVGEQNGTPVASGSPYYENNAKYYKTEAENAVTGKQDAICENLISNNFGEPCEVDLTNVTYLTMSSSDGNPIGSNPSQVNIYFLDENLDTINYFGFPPALSERTVSLNAQLQAAKYVMLRPNNARVPIMLVKGQTAKTYVPYFHKANIESKNTYNISAMIGIQCAGFEAPRQLLVNEIACVNNELYKVTSIIPANSQIIPNTNCQKITVGQILTTFLNS